MSKYINTGILTLNKKQYRIDTYYPAGLRKPEYKIFHVWEKGAVREGESYTFASEEGFFNWLERLDAGQKPLF